MKLINFSISFFLCLNILSIPISNAEEIIKSDKAIDSNAYNYYKQGLELYNLHTPQNYEEAIKYFDKAIEINPFFVEAISHKSIAQSFLAYRLNQNEKEYYKLSELAKKNSDKAILLNNKSPYGYIASSAYSKFNYRESEGLENANKAIKLAPNNADSYFWLWYNYTEQNPDDFNIKQALKLNPDMLIAHSELGNAYFAHGKYEEALYEYQKAIKLNPKYTYAYNNIGAIYGKQEEFEKALYFFKKSLEIEPEDVRAIRNLKEIYDRADQNNKKLLDKKDFIEILKKALITNPNSNTISEILSEILKEMSFENVVIIYKDIYEKSSNPKFELMLADVYLNENKLKEALSIYEKVKETNPDLVYQNNNIFLVYYKLNDYDRFVENLTKNKNYDVQDIITSDWTNSKNHIKLGDYFSNDYYSSKLPLIAYKKAIELDDKNAEAYIKLAKYIDNVSRYSDKSKEDTISYYEKAVALEPKNSEYVFLLADKYFSNNQKDKSISLCKKYLDNDPNNIKFLNKMVDFYYYDNENEATIYLNKILKIEPANFRANDGLANFSLAKNDFNKALNYYKNIISKEPFNYEINNKISDIYHKLGKENEAKNYSFKAKISYVKNKINHFYGDYQAHYELANIYKSEGMINEAIFEFKESIKFNPSYVSAIKNLANTYQLQAKKIKENAFILPLKKSYDKSPRNINNIINLANAYKKFENYDIAESLYKEAINLNNESSDAYNNLSDIYKLRAEIESKKAIRMQKLSLYKDVIKYESSNDKSFYYLALNLKNQGKIHEAIIGFEEAININEYDVEYHLQLADCYKKLEQDSNYKLEMKKACNLGSSEACKINKSK